MGQEVCPVWAGYWLASPIRKLWQNPEKILSDYVKPGMTVIDVGSAMGFFTLPMAQLVDESGSVIAIDVQEKMLEKLRNRARKKNLHHRIQTHLAESTLLNMKRPVESVDFALAFAVVHEVPDQHQLFLELYQVLKDDARVLFAEPKGHVSKEAYSESIREARQAGFEVGKSLDIRGAIANILIRS
ncbi:MAG: methyltransferase domain-containing protein [Candidatus Marinimicrobia bacterium]|nr:methyltransferase domain-containing protein [Candidatus Neomarinimicrobiota bacterium]